MKKPQKVIYYSDELNDEFSSAKIKPKKIDKNYVYLHKNPFWKIARFILYRLIFIPFGWIWYKIKFHFKIKNKSAFKLAKKTGVFVYANHTQETADAFLPTYVCKQSPYIIVHPNNVSMKFLGRLTPFLGALPLPDDMDASRNFVKAINHHIEHNKAVVIYPEAHIWPYYTDIRPFPATSFRYPVNMDKPTFCFTNTYQKRKFGKKPKIVTYVDGPFYPNNALPVKERIQDLRDRVYAQMKLRSELSNVEVIKYIKKENK